MITPISSTQPVTYLQIQSSSGDGSVGMAVVIMTTDAFLPSTAAKLPEGDDDEEVLDTLWEDMKDR